MLNLFSRVGVLVLFAASAWAQQQQNPQLPADGIRPTYVLGPGDQIVIRASEAEDLSDKPFRVEPDGNLTLPLVGKIRAAGISVQQLEALLVERLKPFVRAPQASVTVVQFRSEPVFFVGAFRSPGIYLLLGERTLVEMLASIGGMQPNASRRIRVTRRAEMGKIPLANAIEDAAGKVSYVEIGLGSLRDNVNPLEDITLKPFDVISVERSELVYVTGEFAKVGGIELGERDSISVGQVISLSGGLTRDANASHARILRPVLDSDKRAEIPIDLTKVLKGEVSDFPLRPNDMLHVPRSRKNQIWSRIGLIAVGVIPTLIFAATR